MQIWCENFERRNLATPKVIMVVAIGRCFVFGVFTVNLFTHKQVERFTIFAIRLAEFIEKDLFCGYIIRNAGNFVNKIVRNK